MPDKPKPSLPEPCHPKDPAVYGGQWGEGDRDKKPAGAPPPDRPGKIEQPPETPAPQGGQPPPVAQGAAP